MPTLSLPKKLDFRSLCQAVAASGCDAKDTISVESVDFSHVDWVFPSGMVGLAALVKTPRPEEFWAHASNSRAFRYFQNMDFFSEFGVFQNESFFHKSENLAFARMIKVGWDSDSSRVAKNLAKLVSYDAKRMHGDFFTCLEESVRNVIDHARDPGFAMAQSAWISGGDRVYRIAICDSGWGISKALSENPEFAGLDDRTALEVACRKGTSGAIHRRSPTGDQVNFGLGLYQIDRIAETTNGEFILCSDTAARIREGGKVRYEKLPYWKGTSVEITLYLSGFRGLNRVPLKSGKLRFG